MNVDDAIEVLNDPIENSGRYFEAAKMAIEALEFQESIIYCKDCTFYEKDYEKYGYCKKYSSDHIRYLKIGEEDFCSHAEEEYDGWGEEESDTLPCGCCACCGCSCDDERDEE